MPTELASDLNNEESIFQLLKNRGPLCTSQISVEIRLSPRKVKNSLQALRSRGLVEPRPDRDKQVRFEDIEIPWGISRGRIPWARDAR